jgi:DNA (cytosine-5)-methyltransferase 1
MIVEMMAFDETQITHPENRSQPRPGQPAPALAAGARPPTVVYMQAVADPLVVNERGTYTHEGSGNFRTRNVMAEMAKSEWRVRRLTPVECERLQGFPDGYTNIPWRGKNGAPDGSRYRVLGNSMSANVMRWLGRRIEMVENICK